MRPHPYLRAYMAGIVVPTLFLLCATTVYAIHQFYLEVPSQFIFGIPARPLERMIMFPMAVVPNLWGVWNVVYTAMAPRRLSLGVFGAILPLMLVPLGLALARVIDLRVYTTGHALAILPVGMAIYYLAWKHVVAFFNRVVGLGDAYRRRP